jgi:hypothetical protein
VVRTLARSTLSDEAAALYRERGKSALFDRLRRLTARERGDADLSAWVDSGLRGDDRWLAQNLLRHGAEAHWPPELRLEREQRGWAGTGDPETVAELERGRPLHVPLTVHDSVVDVFVFVDVPGSEEKARGLAGYLAMMPPRHVEVLATYPIFVMNVKPGGRQGGGTWRRGELDALRNREYRTGVPNAYVDMLFQDPQLRGVIGMSRDRWERPLERLKYTVLHEAGHAVDNELGLRPRGATAADYRGVRPTCGGGFPYTAEAYARYILGVSICRDLPDGQAECEARVRALIESSPAFAG